MNENSRTINSIRNIMTGVFGQALQIILGFVSRTVFIKFLAAEYLGISGLFTNILSMLSLAELGVGSAIIFALYKPLAENDSKKLAILMKYYSKAYRVIGVVLAIMGIVLMPFLSVLIKSKPNISESLYLLYLIYLFNTVISYFYSYKGSIIIADQKNYIVSIISYIISVIQTILQIIVIIITKKFVIYLIVQSLCVFANNIMISKTADKLYPFLEDNATEKMDENDRKSITKNIKALMIIKLSGVLVNNTDNIIITYFSGLITVGLCSNYTMLIGIVSTMLTLIFNGVTASVGNLNAQANKRKQVEIFNVINFANFWLYGFSTIGIILVINDVINIWIGTSFILPFNITLILAVNFYIVGMQSAVWTYKNTMGLFRQGRYLLLVTAAINLGLSFWLGDKFGLFGILLATAISRLVTNAWYDPYVVYRYGLKENPILYLVKYLKYLGAVLIVLVITNFVCNIISVTSILTLLLKIILCTVVVNSIFIILFCKTNEFKYLKSITIKLLSKNSFESIKTCSLEYKKVK